MTRRFTYSTLHWKIPFVVRRKFQAQLSRRCEKGKKNQPPPSNLTFLHLELTEAGSLHNFPREIGYTAWLRLASRRSAGGGALWLVAQTGADETLNSALTVIRPIQLVAFIFIPLHFIPLSNSVTPLAHIWQKQWPNSGVLSLRKSK